MRPVRHRSGLVVEQLADISIVKFTRRYILSGETIETLAEHLFSLVENEGHRKLVLNFAQVDRMTSALLGKLILLHRKLKALRGWLVLCKIAPEIYEIFTLLKMHKLLGIYPDEQEALQRAQRRSA